MSDAEARRPSGWMKLLAAAYYCIASMVVQYVTKALFTTYGFTFPVTIALLQMAVIAPVCYVVARPKLEWALARSIMPLAVVNVLNVVSGLVGTGYMNVPMFIALRRMTLLCTIVLERTMMNKRHDRATIGSVAVMIGGALVAAATDLSFNLLGYAAALGNDFLTAWYLIMVKSIPLAQSLTTTGLLFYNAALSLPLLFAAAAMSSELPGIRAYPRKLDSGFQMIFILSCALGLTINHSTFVCTRYNEPLTTSVAGSVKNVLMTLIGAFAFGDFVAVPWNISGLALSMAGAIWYATKTALKARKKSAQQQLLLRDPKAGPMIGRDRLSALRAGDAARNGLSQPRNGAPMGGTAGGSSPSGGSTVPPPRGGAVSPSAPSTRETAPLLGRSGPDMV